jgi:UDP-N-acetylmuramate--alanine ligase
LVARIPADGILVANGDDANVAAVIDACKGRVIRVGFGDTNDYVATSIANRGLETSCEIMHQGFSLGKLILGIPGRHNVFNALAAFAFAREIGIEESSAFASLASYAGAGRRFEFLGERNGVMVYDDYAHHPTEILATAKAYYEAFPDKRLWLAIQFHHYERVQSLYDDFIAVLRELPDFVDHIVLTDIYFVEGRDNEDIKKTVNPEKIVSDVNVSVDVLTYIPKDELLAHLQEHAAPGDVVMTMGAGDITFIGRLFAQQQ